MKGSFEKKEITKKSKNTSEWYTDVVLKSELADYGPVKGTIIFRPYGYKIWENIQKYLDERIKKDLDTQNGYFPLFIPESLLKKEKEHVEGFSPELAVVTIAGGKKLAEPLIVRPTSETIMYDAFSRWIQSHRDLPLKINQWANVVRWEKRPYIFLRNTEFLWQEGHTAHATHQEAQETVKTAIHMYGDFYKNFMAIYGIAGQKSESEKFAGASETYTFEILIPDGKALQGCTSHDLGQNFSKAFGIEFQDKSGNKQYAWQTCWGLSTRSLGALILVHGDDNGLIFPPNAAPVQIVIIIIPGSSSKTFEYSKSIARKLEETGYSYVLDDKENETAGFKFNKWELKGIPVRLEIGEKETERGTITAVLRSNREKLELKVIEFKAIFKDMQNNLFEAHKKFTEENTRNVETYEEFKKIMSTKRGFIKAFWCEDASCETKIKEETKASTRCLPLGSKEENGKCIYCGKPAKNRWLFAQAY